MEALSCAGDLGSANRSCGNRSAAASPLKRNEEVAKVEVAVLALVLALALAGNACVLLAVRASKQGRSRMHYFMTQLSVADLVVAVFQVLPQLIWDITFRFYGPDALCRLVKYLQVVGMFASAYVLVLMSADRCLAVWRPLRSLRRGGGRACVLATWALSLLFSLPQAHIFSLREVEPGVFDCWADFAQPWGARAYVTWVSLSVYVVPVALLGLCYGLVGFRIRQNLRLKAAGAAWRVSSVKLVSRAKIATVKMTFVVVLAYVVCWTPFFFVQMWSAWDPAAPREAMPFIISMLLASLNSCCNPWIYMCFAGHLFRDLQQRFTCCSARNPKSSRCGCERDSSRRSNSSTFVTKSASSQRSVTQTSAT